MPTPILLALPSNPIDITIAGALTLPQIDRWEVNKLKSLLSVSNLMSECEPNPTFSGTLKRCYFLFETSFEIHKHTYTHSNTHIRNDLKITTIVDDLFILLHKNNVRIKTGKKNILQKYGLY